MSRVSVRTPARGEQDLSARVADLARLTRRTMTATMDAGRPLLDAYTDMLRAGLSAAGGRRTSRCHISETECPPYCVCQINWEATRGEHLRATIHVTNTGNQARSFAFLADPFHGPSGDTGVVPSLNPSTATLKPNESVVVNAGLDVGEQFQPDGTYSTEVKIQGLYEQCVRLQLDVQAERVPHCEVRQGEIPTRIRAHHWYDHFQCEEPCFEPVRRKREFDQPPG